jgi:hypothetical protein
VAVQVATNTDGDRVESCVLLPVLFVLPAAAAALLHKA